MKNYGEELAYWYLRFNGFFPITDFVIHRSGHASDCDILAIRTPYVREEIGGQQDDWDTNLTRLLGSFTSFKRTIGLICAVTTEVGLRDFSFPDDIIDVAVDRLGFAANTSEIKAALRNQTCHLIGEQYQIAKLLIANNNPSNGNSYLFITLEDTHDFIVRRITKYIDPKHSAKHQFNSNLIQEHIWDIRRHR